MSGGCWYGWPMPAPKVSQGPGPDVEARINAARERVDEIYAREPCRLTGKPPSLVDEYAAAAMRRAGIGGEPLPYWRNNLQARGFTELADWAAAASTTKESPEMPKSNVPRACYINAGYRFDFYDDHTKVKRIDYDKREEEVVSCYPPVLAEPGPRCATEADVPFKLWPDEADVRDALSESRDSTAALYLVDGFPVSKEYFDLHERGPYAKAVNEVADATLALVVKGLADRVENLEAMMRGIYEGKPL